MNRFKQIDILRALAVFLVLGRHMIPCPAEVSPLLHSITEVWAQGGWVGVDLFFVLSGFLVSGLLFREYEKHQALRIGHFLIRRGFKIYPPFWILIGATTLFTIYKEHHFPLRPLASELLFLQNYLPWSFWNHTWSLAVEEHFYFLLALLFFWLVRRKTSDPFRVIPMAFLLIAVTCLAARILVADSLPYKHKTHLYPTHLRLDALFFGVLLSHVFHRHPAAFLTLARRFRYPLAIIGGLMLVPAFCNPLESTSFIPTYGLTLFYIGSGCLVIAALGARNPRAITGKFVAYVGSHSYSIYLWHMPVAIWGTAAAGSLLSPRDNWPLYATTYLVGSLLIGIGLAILTEIPVLKLRDRLFPSRGTPLSSRETGANNALQIGT